MLKQGFIRLVDRRGDIIRSHKYNSPSERREYFEDWKASYGEPFNYCSIQICPDTDISLVDIDGSNKKVKKKHQYAARKKSRNGITN